jgi:hypothetical protein
VNGFRRVADRILLGVVGAVALGVLGHLATSSVAVAPAL